MNLEKIMLTVNQSHSFEWQKVSDTFGNDTIFYKYDVALHFRMNDGDAGVQCEDFREPWANCHPNSAARGYWVDLYYGVTLIERFVLVSVDGGRALIPPPSVGTTTISKRDYNIAQITRSGDHLDSYIARSKLNVES